MKIFDRTLGLLAVALISLILPLRAQRITLASHLKEAGPRFGIYEQFGFGADYYFTTFDGTRGTTLYKIDGASGSISMIRQFSRPGANYFKPMCPVEYKGKLWFAQEENFSTELWTSDGTTAGTIRFAEIRPGNPNKVASGYYGFQIFNGELYFLLQDTVGYECMLWKTDGSVAGSREVYRIPNYGQQIGGAFLQMPSINGKLIFFGADYSGSKWLYQSDGTAAGTSKSVRDFGNSVNVLWKNRILSMHYLTDSMFISDGTSRDLVKTGVQLWTDHYATNDAFFFFYNGVLYETRGAPNDVRAIFSQTQRAQYEVPPAGNRLYGGQSHSFATDGRMLYFTDDTVIYRYDVTAVEIHAMHKFRMFEYDPFNFRKPFPNALTYHDGKLFFKVFDSLRTELFEMETASGAVRKIAYPNANFQFHDPRMVYRYPIQSDPMIRFNNTIYFTAAYDSTIGEALYKLECPVSVPETAKLKTTLGLTPNPSTGLVSVVAPEGTRIRDLIIRDASGKTVLSVSYPDLQNTTLDLRYLPAGIYSVTARTNVGTTSTKQLALTK